MSHKRDASISCINSARVIWDDLRALKSEVQPFASIFPSLNGSTGSCSTSPCNGAVFFDSVVMFVGIGLRVSMAVIASILLSFPPTAPERSPGSIATSSPSSVADLKQHGTSLDR
jgi:hypothetical protein